MYNIKFTYDWEVAMIADRFSSNSVRAFFSAIAWTGSFAK